MDSKTQKIKELNIKRIAVVSAKEMYEACIEQFGKADITVMAAAVADYTYNKTEKNKLKKQDSSMTITLEPTKDILNELGKRKKANQILAGFAIETENEIENAKNKLKNKNLDIIVLNSLNDKGAGFNYKTNKITIIDKQNNIKDYPLKSKEEVAKDIVSVISSKFKI